AKACSTLLATKFLKSSCRARKSVWELTSMITARLLSSATLTAIEPSAAMLPAFLAALMAPAARMSSMAFSMSPPAAVSAFLQSLAFRYRHRPSLGRPIRKWQRGGIAPFLLTGYQLGVLLAQP